MRRGGGWTAAAGWGAALLLGGATAAQGQNALGDGRALDSNLRVGSGGVNPKGRDLLAEIRFRNAIVTGNAPAGLSLRVGVGYTAADDFRQALGSNDTFAFDRDAVYSSVAGRGVRGIDALQWQMRLTTGGPLEGEAPLLPIVSRAGAGASGASLTGPALIDPFTLRPRSLRSTTQYLASEALAPLTLGAAQLEEGDRVYAVASPLRGVQMRSASPDDVLALPLTTLEELTWLGAAPGLRKEQEAEKPTSPMRLSGKIEPDLYSFDRVVSQIGERMTELREQEEQGRQPTQPGERGDADRETPAQLQREPAQRQSLQESTAADAQRASEALQERLLALREALAPALQGGAEEDEEEGAGERLVRRIIEASGGLVVRSLAAEGEDPRSTHARMVRAGESLLSQGRWFDAEEMFTRALTAAPGDPRAAVGRAHAQIGAGLYVSAAVNLEQLFLKRPELAALRYDARLLPSAQRLAAVTASLRRLVEPGGAMARRAGLLLAYLGWQLGDQSMVREGVEALARTSDRDDPTLRLVRTLWLAQGEDQPRP